MIINYSGIYENKIAPLVGELSKERPGQGLIICSSASRAKRIAGDLSFFTSVPVLVLPDVETATLRYDAKSTAELDQRLHVLNALVKGEKVIVVAPVLGALKKLPPRDVYLTGMVNISLGQQIKREKLVASLAALGYERVSNAEAQGQFAVRGDIVDIFAPGYNHPVRIELFDEDIDSIRSYDELSQRSIQQLDSISITPAQLMVKDSYAFEQAVNNITAAYNKVLDKKYDAEAQEKLRNQRDYLIDCIEEGMNLQYLEAFISYFYSEPSFVWDYMAQPSFVIVDDPSRIGETMDFYGKEDIENRKILLERFQAIADDFESNPDERDLEKINYLAYDGADVIYTTPFSQAIRYIDRLDALKQIRCEQAPIFSGHMEMLETELKRFQTNGFKTIIACSSDERVENLKDFVERIGVSSSVEVRFGTLSQGTIFYDLKQLYLSENDIFTASSLKKVRKHKKGREIKVFTDINTGDYVVHENHGVGQFLGIEKLSVDGSTRDYLRIQYAGSDVLFIPVDQLESIQKYVGSDGVSPKVSKLSGGEWQLTKAKAKAAIKDMAEDLLKLSAQRAMNPGHRFDPDDDWQRSFEDAFPYAETEDQLRCIQEIKKDMQSDKAMDRLLCGDVGYGKTEVAARAVFKCIEQGKQAAVLVPTTILANQHYLNFIKRFDGFPFKIDTLSRFRTEKQQEETLAGLASGSVDLVVGTHRILSKDVRFKDLGLLVIDEEQRFGVEHKEAIKQLKTNVDVLTLSATPIPRTLHMSLIGVKDMSVIEEPPEDRYPVQTYVLQQDDNMIADAIRRELGRDGQVYVVYNRVRGIQTMARHLQELVPEAKIAVGHGQMGERALEDVMISFTAGEFNVLLATTIIESGLDIPNVNTMIIMDADRFGLSQLYQLRGRVGRSSRMAYAYLVYKKDKVLSEVAEKRLRAMREFTEFGSGFRIAMRDLELRGAGNILGVEQSGHMVSVGYELYCKMVEEAVAELTGEESIDRPLNADSSVELPVSAFIPETYIADEHTRLIMYKRIASIFTEEDRREITDELIDRFGDISRETDNLLDLAMIRNKASRCGVAKVIQQKGNVVLLFEENNALNPRVFGALMDRYGDSLQIYAGKEPRLAVSYIGKTSVETSMELLDLIVSVRYPAAAKAHDDEDVCDKEENKSSSNAEKSEKSGKKQGSAAEKSSGKTVKSAAPGNLNKSAQQASYVHGSRSFGPKSNSSRNNPFGGKPLPKKK